MKKILSYILISIFFIPTAFAAGGDFSIFRESAANQNIPIIATKIPWDTIVTESTSITKNVNETDITLTE